MSPEDAEALRLGLPTVRKRPRPWSRARVEYATTEDVARALGVTRRTVQRWIRGVHRPRAIRLRTVDVMEFVRRLGR